MARATLDKRIVKNLKQFEKVETDYEKSQVIHSLIHKIQEIYCTSVGLNGCLTTIENNTIEDLWCELYLMVKDVADPIRERKGINMFDHLF
tara:strand:- start:49 stop:321 length:273 start_codon:yes stop_codon:yes gene_type:complete